MKNLDQVPLLSRKRRRTMLSPGEIYLMTIFNGTSISYGNMFSITGQTTIDILRFDIHTNRPNATLQYFVYSILGHYEPCVTSLSCWGAAISSGYVTGRGPGRPTSLPYFAHAVRVGANETRSFYVTLTTADIRYSVGRVKGGVLVENGEVGILEGAGIGEYPLGFRYSEPRVWDGILYYRLIDDESPEMIIQDPFLASFPSPPASSQYPPFPPPSSPPPPPPPSSPSPTQTQTQNMVSLTTTYYGTLISIGNMFDVVAKKGVNIHQMAIHVETSMTLGYEVYSINGGYKDCLRLLGCWGEPIAAGHVKGKGPGVPSELPIFYQPVRIEMGAIRAFYVTLTSPHMRYIAGTKTHRVFVENNDLAILQGAGIGSYPLGSKNSEPRVWNGALYYTTGNVITSEPTMAPVEPVFSYVGMLMTSTPVASSSVTSSPAHSHVVKSPPVASSSVTSSPDHSHVVPYVIMTSSPTFVTPPPTKSPSSSPTNLPSLIPSSSPTAIPSISPTLQSSHLPSISLFPTNNPSILPTSAHIQPFNITTSANGNISSFGCMFDVTALSDVSIVGMDFLTNRTAYTSDTSFQIYTKRGSYVNFETKADQWTLAAEGLLSTPPPSLIITQQQQPFSSTSYYTAVPSNLWLHPLRLQAHDTRAFYVTLSNKELLISEGTTTTKNSSMTAAAAAAYYNTHLRIDEGIGVEARFPFSHRYDVGSRVWNGVLHYKAIPPPTMAPTIPLLTLTKVVYEFSSEHASIMKEKEIFEEMGESVFEYLETLLRGTTGGLLKLKEMVDNYRLEVLGVVCSTKDNTQTCQELDYRNVICHLQCVISTSFDISLPTAKVHHAFYLYGKHVIDHVKGHIDAHPAKALMRITLIGDDTLTEMNDRSRTFFQRSCFDFLNETLVEAMPPMYVTLVSVTHQRLSSNERDRTRRQLTTDVSKSFISINTAIDAEYYFHHNNNNNNNNNNDDDQKEEDNISLLFQNILKQTFESHSQLFVNKLKKYTAFGNVIDVHEVRHMPHSSVESSSTRKNNDRSKKNPSKSSLASNPSRSSSSVNQPRSNGILIFAICSVIGFLVISLLVMWHYRRKKKKMTSNDAATASKDDEGAAAAINAEAFYGMETRSIRQLFKENDEA